MLSVVFQPWQGCFCWLLCSFSYRFQSLLFGLLLYGRQSPINESSTAQPLSAIGLNSPVNAAINQAEDEDWYRFEAVAGRTYVIETFNASSSFNISGQLWMWAQVYDSSVNEVARDYFNNGSGDVVAGVQFIAGITGIHYIQVRAASRNNSGNYSLRVLPRFDEPGASWDNRFEPNNFSSNAYEIRPGRNNALTAFIEGRSRIYTTFDPDED